MTEAMPSLRKYDITFLRPPARPGDVYISIVLASRMWLWV